MPIAPNATPSASPTRRHRFAQWWRGLSVTEKTGAISALAAILTVGLTVWALMDNGNGGDRKGSAGAGPSASPQQAEASRPAPEPTPTPSPSISASASDTTPPPTPSAPSTAAPAKLPRTEKFQLTSYYGFALNADPMKPKASDKYKEKDVYLDCCQVVSVAEGGQFAQLEPTEQPTYDTCMSKSNYKKGFYIFNAKNADVCVFLANGAVGNVHVGERTNDAYALTVTVWTDPRPVETQS
ncbi:hypothetical protein [Streptomyces sp. NPDC097619]|uniref:hypothetical protein n=1 Tax=Streptomyces sp. NPDC097619 TaxID=3157228 RepID=UPI003328B46F